MESMRKGIPMKPQTRPTILYIGYEAHVMLRRRRLDGIRRCAVAHGWDVATLSVPEADLATVRKTLASLRPVGCIVECWLARSDMPPRIFGSVPTVFFNPPERREWIGVATVGCNEAAVARAAFNELSAGLPSSYAVVAEGPTRKSPWARDRIAAFRDCCRKDGKTCHVFPEHPGERTEARLARLESWTAALPIHCAIFAVNDIVAMDVSHALTAAGRSIPRSATLVGVDAAEAPEDDLPASSISSVKIDFELSGYLAAKMIAARCDGSAAATYGPLLVERRQSTRGHGRREPWVLKAVEIIRREACDGLSVAKLADQFPGSRRLFEMRFREAMGHSVLDEILQTRLERVFDLLSRPDFPIGAIADFCGFGCGYELRKLFRSRTGMSLREWRKARL